MVPIVNPQKGHTDTMPTSFLSATVGQLRSWPARRLVVAALTAAATAVLTAIPTDLIDTPLFTREIPPTWWAWPVLAVNAVLAGLVTASYVARRDTTPVRDTGTRFGTVGALTTFFAVGCPVCNKPVLLVLGYTGAIQFFEPVQPYLALASVALLTWALGVRLSRERSCPAVPATRPAPRDSAANSG